VDGGGGMIEIVPKVLVELGIRQWRQIQGPKFRRQKVGTEEEATDRKSARRDEGVRIIEDS
jgi:hypothetical protein